MGQPSGTLRVGEQGSKGLTRSGKAASLREHPKPRCSPFVGPELSTGGYVFASLSNAVFSPEAFMSLFPLYVPRQGELFFL